MKLITKYDKSELNFHDNSKTGTTAISDVVTAIEAGMIYNFLSYSIGAAGTWEWINGKL